MIKRLHNWRAQGDDLRTFLGEFVASCHNLKSLLVSRFDAFNATKAPLRSGTGKSSRLSSKASRLRRNR